MQIANYDKLQRETEQESERERQRERQRERERGREGDILSSSEATTITYTAPNGPLVQVFSPK